MRASIVPRAPCELQPGELRRVPQNPQVRVVGYHLACPRCGFVSIAVDGSDGLVITEGAAPGEVSFSRPPRCAYCGVLVGLEAGELTPIEDEHVRPVPPRG